MCWIVWDKKQDNFSFSDGELAWTSFNTKLQRSLGGRDLQQLQKREPHSPDTKTRQAYIISGFI
jgi:hypothetical protein